MEKEYTLGKRRMWKGTKEGRPIGEVVTVVAYLTLVVECCREVVVFVSFHYQ